MLRVVCVGGWIKLFCYIVTGGVIFWAPGLEYLCNGMEVLVEV
jgi:hypothetical protein